MQTRRDSCRGVWAEGTAARQLWQVESQAEMAAGRWESEMTRLVGRKAGSEQARQAESSPSPLLEAR